jgi:glutamate synthase domain-containing protein 3
MGALRELGAEALPAGEAPEPIDVDLDTVPVRLLNEALHRAVAGGSWVVGHPAGRHSIAVGIDAAVRVRIEGHVGYDCAGMNQVASIVVTGNAGTGVAENMMSGSVHVLGDASQSAGATGHGGLLVIEGNATARCGISMKGIDIVVGGNAGHMSAFMAQSGRLVICGDAGDGLGDSLYEAQIYLRGRARSLGADCIEKPMGPPHLDDLAALLRRAGRDEDPGEFRRYGSARRLYNFHIDNAGAY